MTISPCIGFRITDHLLLPLALVAAVGIAGCDSTDVKLGSRMPAFPRNEASTRHKV